MWRRGNTSRKRNRSRCPAPFSGRDVAENDKIVSRYMEDAEFQNTAFPLLAQAIFETIRERELSISR